MDFKAYKVLRVDGDSANRDIGEVIRKKVDELLGSVNGELVDLKISIDLNVTYGRALVTVFYNPGPEKEPVKSGKSNK